MLLVGGGGVTTGLDVLPVGPATVVVTTEETIDVTVRVMVTGGTVLPEPRVMVMEEVTMLVTVTVETAPPDIPHEPNWDWHPPPQKESSLPQ